MKNPCLPVGYCFPASIPLLMETYSIHKLISIFRNGYLFTQNLCSMFERICPIVVEHGTIEN